MGCIFIGIILMMIPKASPGKVSPSIQLENNLSPEQLGNSGIIYCDKVYTFSHARDTYYMTLDFARKYMHTISVRVVTSNSCMMNITIWDPLGREFQIFYGYIDQEMGMIDIPFGTAEEGNHTIQFQATVDKNLNILLHVMRTDTLCLYDRIISSYHGKIIFYEVTCFSDGYIQIHNELPFKTDYSYKFYMGRVSAIASHLSNLGWITFYNITDPYGIQFNIYENETLAGLVGVNFFDFGTATAGEYAITIKIDHQIPYMNIAYAIVEDGPISNVIDPNKSKPIFDGNGTILRDYFYVPFEWGLATVVIAGLFAGGLVIYVVYQRRKNAISLDFKK